MTGAERAALLKLITRRANVAKADVTALGAERLAEFERQSAELWTAEKAGIDRLIGEANALLGPIVEQARAMVEQRCDELGVHPEFRPRVSGGVMLGYSIARALPERRAELRRVAKAEIEAAMKRAKTEIERARADLETQVLASAIGSPQAGALLASMPTAEALLPPLDVRQLESRSDR